MYGTFERMQQWFEKNEERRTSGEADYGVHWHDGERGQTYRVSYVQATGEIYAVGNTAPVPPVEVLGVVTPDADEEDGRNVPYYRTLDTILDGWADAMHTGGLDWVRRRLRKSIQTQAGSERVRCASCDRSMTTSDCVCFEDGCNEVGPECLCDACNVTNLVPAVAEHPVHVVELLDAGSAKADERKASIVLKEGSQSADRAGANPPPWQRETE